MERLYMITGANGHLGNTLIRQLLARKQRVRGLILPEETGLLEGVEYVQGDIRDPYSLERFFDGIQGYEVIVIHTAGIVDIAEKVSPALYEVNVVGTRRLLSACLNHSIKRLVYVSSVHALPEKDHFHVLQEVRHFSPDSVVGGYAKTKAEATQAVLDAVACGLDAVIVHPSGILGPYDTSRNHLVQLVSDYIHGHLPACVRGGYDFVDVRDVAQGCLAAADFGRTGDCYILSNRHYEIKELLGMIRSLQGGKKVPSLPLWMAKIATPFIELDAKRRHRRPLYTRYSLYTLQSNDKFSHDKATKELGYHPRDLYQTLADTIAWMKGKRKEIPAT